MIRWLASYPKSGNTWVRLFLTAYRNGGELDALRDLLGMSDLNPYLHQVVSPKPIGDLTDYEVTALRHAVLLHVVTASNGTPVHLKTHHAYAEYQWVKLFPRPFVGPSVYVVRDPRDVACSYAHHMGVDVEDAIEQMADRGRVIRKVTGSPLHHTISSWSNHVRSWTAVEQACVVRYEDMYERPTPTFTRIVEHLYDGECDPDTLQASIRAVRFNRMRALEAEHGFGESSEHQERFFRQGVAGGWRDELDPALAFKIEQQHEDQMIAHGYLGVAVAA